MLEAESEAHRNDVAPGPVRGAVGPGHRAHLDTVGAAATGAHPAAVEPPMEPDAGQKLRAAAAQRLHGLAAGRGDLPLALPGERDNFFGLEGMIILQL